VVSVSCRSEGPRHGSQPQIVTVGRVSRLQQQRAATARRPQWRPRRPQLDPPGLAGPNFAVSSGGTLAYIASGSPAWAGLNEGRVVWMDAQGATDPLADLEGYVEIPRLSPDGRRLAYANFSASGAYDVWVRDLDSRQEWRVTRQGVVNNFPVWSPDGTQLAFNSARVPFGIYAKAADGTGEAELLVPRRPPFPQLPGSWSFDGLALAFTEVNGQGRGDIWVYTRATGATELLATDADESTPRFSPTAGLLAYVADASDVHEVHVRRYPDRGEDLVVSVGGGTAPAWSPDGSHLYYRRGDAMMKVDIMDGDRLAAGRPTLVVEAELIGGSFGYTNYDVVSGERFLVVEPRTDVPTTSVNVVLNWFTSLRALMGQ